MKHDPTSTMLSPRGAARREAMLHELTTAMLRHHRRRRVQRRAILSVVVIAASMAPAWMLLRPVAPEPTGAVALRAPAPQPDPEPSPTQPQRRVIQVVQTSATVLERYRPAKLEHVVRLDDQGLIETLHEIDRPAGVVRSEGRVWLTAPVTDDEVKASSGPVSFGDIGSGRSV